MSEYFIPHVEIRQPTDQTIGGKMHALGKNDGINVPQKIVSHVDLRPKKLSCQRQRVDRLFVQRDA